MGEGHTGEPRHRQRSGTAEPEPRPGDGTPDGTPDGTQTGTHDEPHTGGHGEPHGGQRLDGGEDGTWRWVYQGYAPAEERLREALCTLGNGFFATRGAAPEATAGEHHYPGTYAAGCYDRLTSTVAGRRVENEDLVNLPNWLPLRFRMHDERGASPWWSTELPGLVEYTQELALRDGVLVRAFTWQCGPGRRLRVEQTRWVSMADPHLAALRTTFTALGWSGRLEVESALDAEVTNSGVERYRELDGEHLTAVRTGTSAADGAWVSCRTRTSGIAVALASRTRTPPPLSSRPTARTSGHRPGHRFVLELAAGVDVTVDKLAVLHTAGDGGPRDPLRAALDQAAHAPGLDEVLDAHRRAWHRTWERAELTVPGPTGRILRLHLFHVLQTLSPHTAALDVGVPARGLHGEAYRGHVFWDELFVLPFLDLHLPEVSRALLTYRHRRLPAARRAAREAGLVGAMYPWQSGSDGREATQTLHLNPASGRWLPDRSHLQRHVGSAIAYNIWRYAEATGDREFLFGDGAEMLLGIAQFWSGLARYDEAVGRYRIRGVVGPDEYHDGYPGSERAGVDDNTYTNVTASWVLSRAVELAARLPRPRRDRLFDALRLGRDETARWDEVSRRLLVPFHEGVICQFDGYCTLEELNWTAYRARYGDIRRLDRILEAEGDSVNRYQASKQADVLMLGYLFPPDRLAEIFAHLGYRIDDEVWRRTVEYYLARTSHGSTLSALVHGWILARERRPQAWQHMREALLGDVADVQGGTTAEGIHLGAMAGTLDLVQRGLTGLEVRDGALHLDPAPLPELYTYRFTLRIRHHRDISVRLSSDAVEVGLPAAERTPLRVLLRGRPHTVWPGRTRRMPLPP